MSDLIKISGGEIMSLHQIKNIEFYSRELGGQVTIGKFLIELLTKLWSKKDQFSGKRPFGNSFWEYDLYIALIDNNIVKGRIDEWDDVESFDQSSADKIILDIIQLGM
jgi:hypothetical protein